MPKRKITLAEAFDVIEQHGLVVEVTKPSTQTVETLADFIEQPQPTPVAGGMFTNKSKKTVKLTLFCQHTIGSGGENIGTEKHPHIINNGVVIYGPGNVEVPEHMAAALKHQDQLAQEADNRTFDKNMRSVLVMTKGTKHFGVDVGHTNDFDMSGLLGSLHESLLHRIR